MTVLSASPPRLCFRKLVSFAVGTPAIIILTIHASTLEARHSSCHSSSSLTLACLRSQQTHPGLVFEEEYDPLSLGDGGGVSTITDICTTLPRGGSLQSNRKRSDSADHTSTEESSSVVVQKVRNMIRSLLEIGDRKSPVLSKVVRQAVSFLENVMGVKLLPAPKTKKSKRKKKTRITTDHDDNTAETEEAISTASVQKKKKRRASKSLSEKIKKPTKDESNNSSTHRPKSTPAPFVAKPKAAKGRPAKNKNAPTAAKTHLARDLKATNPNYRIQRELRAFLKSPPPNLRVSVGKNMRVWIVTISGAPNTIYHGESYRLKVTFPPNYPTVPPSMFFLNPTPRHEHVYTNGDICLSLLGKDWRPTMTAQSLAVSILSILSGAREKQLPMDNARHAVNKPGQPQDDWVYHDDNC